MASNINLQTTVEAWADIVLKNWTRKISELGIGETGDLYDSFVHNVLSNTSGDPERIEFSHIYYGIFTDMGVGNGTSYGTNRDTETKRRAKPWRSKQLFSQTARLSEIMAEKYGMIAGAIIKENIEENERLYKGMSANVSFTAPQSKMSESDKAYLRIKNLISF